MTSEERILAALRCEQPDRVPVTLFLNPYQPAGWQADDPSYAAVLEACRDYADTIFDWGCPLGGIFCSAAELPRRSVTHDDGTTEHIIETPRGPVSSLTASDWRGGGVRKRWICTVEDARRFLSIPDAEWHPDVAPFLATRDAWRGTGVAQATFPDPLCVVGGLTDEETLSVWTVEERDLLREILDVLCARLERLVTYCLQQGVGPLYYFNGPEYALPPLMAPRDFDEFVVAYDARLIARIHAYPNRHVIVHSHGRVNHFLERFADMGADGLNVLEPPPVGDVVLAEAKRRVGKRMCLIGNIQYDDLARGSAAEVDALVADAIRQGALGGGFILSPCAAPYERPLPAKASDNFLTYLHAGRRYGAYPLQVPAL